MKAIMVKYLPPTAVKGARMKAYAEGTKPVIEGYDYGTADEPQAFELAQKLATLASWGRLHPVAGWTGKEWVFTFQNDGTTESAYTTLESARSLITQRYREQLGISQAMNTTTWERETAAGQTFALAYVSGILGMTLDGIRK